MAVDHESELRAAGEEYRRVRAALRRADARRARKAKAAHTDGGMPMREIARHLGTRLTIVARLLRR